MASQKVILQSSDGENFNVDLEVAKCFKAIVPEGADLGVYEEGAEEPIPLPNVNAATLRKVLVWAEHYKDEPEPAQDDDEDEKNQRSVDLSSWDFDYLKIDQGTLFELILAANYLDIKGLLNITCKFMANKIKGKTPEEIRKFFNIRNALSPEEEEQIRKENEWKEEK